MKKLFLVLIYLLMGFSSIYTQTLEETEDWIKVKIESNPSENSQYKIDFKDSTLIINRTLELDGLIGKEDIIVKIKDIYSISFTSYQETVWLQLSCKSNDNCIKIVKHFRAGDEISYDSKYSLILGKGLENDDLKNRLTNAFRHLIDLCGGKMLKEVF